MLRFLTASLLLLSLRPALADDAAQALSPEAAVTSTAESQVSETISPSVASSLSASASSSNQIVNNWAVNLQDCFKATLKQSEAYGMQKELVVQAKEVYNQAIGAVMPNIAGNAVWFLEDGHDLPPLIPVTAEQNTYKLTLNQPLFEGMKEYAALRQTNDSISYNNLSVNAVALSLYGGVAQNFYLVLALQKDISTQEEEVDLYNQRIVELKGFVQIGRSRIPEILTVQAALATLLAQIEASKAQLAVAQESLAFFTGLSSDCRLLDEESLPSQLKPLDEYLGRVEARPDVLAAEAATEVVKEDVNLAEGGHYPTLDLSADYYLQRPEGLTQDVDWDGQLELNVPLFSGGQVSAQVRQAQSQYREAELGLEETKRLDIEAIRAAYDNVEYDQTQINALVNAADINHKNYDAEREDYSHGLVTNQDVLTALTSYEDAKRALDKVLFACKGDFASLKSLTADIQIPDLGEK